MVKASWKPGTMLWPLPAVMVTSIGAGADAKANIITLSWVGTINSDPPMLSISVRPDRHSYGLIEATGEFTVNIPSLAQAKATDYCGCVSGRNEDKWAKTGLTPGKSLKVKAPVIAECPVSIECRVRQKMNLGSHVMFIADVLAVQVDQSLVNEKDRFALEKAGLFAYAHGHYYALGKKLGRFGFSVRKKPVRQGARSTARPVRSSSRKPANKPV